MGGGVLQGQLLQLAPGRPACLHAEDGRRPSQHSIVAERSNAWRRNRSIPTHYALVPRIGSLGSMHQRALAQSVSNSGPRSGHVGWYDRPYASVDGANRYNAARRCKIHALRKRKVLGAIGARHCGAALPRMPSFGGAAEKWAVPCAIYSSRADEQTTA